MGTEKTECLERNKVRPEAHRVPPVAIHTADARYEAPTTKEGFTQIMTAFDLSKQYELS